MIGNNVSLRGVKGNYKIIDKIKVRCNLNKCSVTNYVVLSLSGGELKIIEPIELKFLEN